MTWGCKPENYPDGCGWAARLTYPRMGHEEWWCDTCERAGGREVPRVTPPEVTTTPADQGGDR